jgi:c-di-AMP phosphodiesterase-like protein
MTDDKFSILNEVKTVEFPDSVPATLSIAFSDDGDTGIKKVESARAVIDIALGRGGDQAIIKENNNYKFFGGRTTEVEKRTKVKARMISHGLQKLIEESDNVLLMGHSNSDMDAIGSCMGLYRLAKTLGKDAYIVNNSLGIGIDGFIDKLKQSPEYESLLINTDEALDLITDNTLLIVTDTSRKNYVDSPEVLEKAGRVVIIDHHRRSTDFIDNALLTFQEVYASSSCELVTEIIEYATKKIELTELEVEALYSGIMLDTKNFTFKTGVRTFEAAAFLRRNGVDIIKVKKWFQSDILTYQAISSVVSSAEIMNNNIAIALYDKEEDKNANITAAKAADELLTIGGIVASFVLTKMGEKVYISGRSIGDINVQLILEKLGGGGHITLAGAQLEGYSLEEAKQELINRINEYFFETEN